MEQSAGPTTRTHEALVCGVPTRFVLTAYSNRIFVVVTQSDNFGTLIAAQNESPMTPSTCTYSTKILLGRRDDESLESYARTLCELIYKRNANAGQLLLAISIKEHSPETFRGVMKELEANRVW